MSAGDRIDAAVSLVGRFGGIDGAHHKQWVIDQALRALLAERYQDWVADYERPTDDNGEEMYVWDTGIAP